MKMFHLNETSFRLPKLHTGKLSLSLSRWRTPSNYGHMLRFYIRVEGKCHGIEQEMIFHFYLKLKMRRIISRSLTHILVNKLKKQTGKIVALDVSCFEFLLWELSCSFGGCTETQELHRSIFLQITNET